MATENSITFEENENHESGLRDWELLSLLWTYLAPYKTPLILSVILLPLVSASEIAQPFIIRWAVDGPIKKGDLPGLLTLCAGFLGLLALHYVLRYYQMKLSQEAGAHIVTDLRNHLYDHLQTLSPRFFQKTPTGKLVTRLTSDVENLSEMFSSGGIAILMDIGMIVAAVFGMFFMHWPLALITSLVFPFIFISMEYFRRRSRNAYDAIRVKIASINIFLQENLSSMDLVKLYQREGYNEALFSELNKNHLQSNLESVLSDSAFSAVVESLTYFTLTLILGVGILALVGNGGQPLPSFLGLDFSSAPPITFGLLIAFFQFVQMLFSPIEDVSEKYTIIQSGLASLDKLSVLFKEKPEVVSNSMASIPAAVISSTKHPAVISSSQNGHFLPNTSLQKGELQCEHVSFAYNEGAPIIQDFSLTIPRGEKVAIVGPSGSGKTTLIKLLTRFYDPNQGRVLLDGQDLRTLDLHETRRNMIVIQQDDVLFSRSIAENITLDIAPTKDESKTARLQVALQQANATALVERLPNGVEEILQERGKNLSSGERQLIQFARAFYHDPPVLILDEATSAIDPMTERLVQEATERLMQGRTVIVIAHRLSSLEKMDRILVLEKGRLLESGSHLQLLENQGLYASYVNQQAL